MRLPLVLISALAVSSATASGIQAAERPGAAAAQDTCRKPTSYHAGRGMIHRGERLAPKKLTELPQAKGYMAVYRVVNGCEVPMTMTEYRTGRRP